jgi:hypothetical protein
MTGSATPFAALLLTGACTPPITGTVPGTSTGSTVTAIQDSGTTGGTEVWHKLLEDAVRDETTDQHHASICARSDGTQLVVWFDENNGSPGVFGRAFDPVHQPLSDPVLITQSGSGPGRPDCVATPDGWWVSWGTTIDVYAMPTALDGSPVQAAQKVNQLPGEDPDKGHPDVAALTDGSFVVVYDLGYPSDPTWTRYRYRRVGADFLPIGDEVEFGTSDNVGSPPDVVALPDGVFAVGWTDRSPNENALRLTWVARDDTVLETQSVESDTSGGDPSRPMLDAADDGRLVLAWRRQNAVGVGEGALFRTFGTDRSPMTPATLLDPTGDEANVAIAADTFFCTWQALDELGVRAQAWSLDADQPLTPAIAVAESTGLQTRPALSAQALNGGFDVVFSLENHGGVNRRVIRSVWHVAP